MIPVHNHSEFSALDGYSTADEIAARIRELGLPGAFLTDHGTVAGFPDFRKAMGDLFVGYGMEAYQARYGVDVHSAPGSDKNFRQGEDAFHLVLLAANPTGYRNLLRLSDAAHRHGFYYMPRLDVEILKEHREGIVATSACMGSLVNQRLMEDDLKPLDDLLRVFRENFYIELHTYDTDLQRELNDALVEVAQKKGIPVLYANDAHYAQRSQHEIHEVLLCAQYGEKLTDEKGRKVDGEFRVNHPDHPTWHHPPCLYIMSEEEVRGALSNLPASVVDEAIANSDALMDLCDFRVEPEREHLPVYRGRDDQPVDTEQAFIDLIQAGLDEHYPDASDEEWERVIERVDDECDALLEKGLQDYFLIVHDYIQHAQEQGWLVGPGRGSVGGSLVAYLLGITNIDPLTYDLPFARFWNKDRTAGLPDIDTDFQKEHRQDMLLYARHRWGEYNVLPIGNHMRMRARQAILKAHSTSCPDVDYTEVNKINKILDNTDDAGNERTWYQIFEEPDPDGPIKLAREELAPFQEKYPLLFETAAQLFGRLSTYGAHASAVVIADHDLRDRLPARSSKGDANKRVMVTQAEMHQVEDAGYPKFDFLGLKTLDMLMEAARLTGEFGSDVEITRFYRDLDLDALPEEAYEMLDMGDTLGLFQIDVSQLAQSVAHKVRPRSLEDLAAIVALNNPGPVRSGAVDLYAERKALVEEGETADPSWYEHELLEPVLRESYGLFVYQEQIMRFFTDVLGYEATYADHMRKIIGKKQIDKMAEEKPLYMERAQAAGFTRKEADRIWKAIEEFSRYGFNKAHAVGYGMLLAWTLYAKYSWPTEFIMAGLKFNPEKVKEYVNEARRLGVQVLGPDANRSQVLLSKIGEDAIIYGLRDIKGIGSTAARWIVDGAPWESPDDVLVAIKETDRPPFNLGHFERLNEAGAFDSFGYRMAKCPACDGAGTVSTMVPKKNPAYGMKRARVDCEECETSGYVLVDPPAGKERRAIEERLLGLPLTEVADEILERHAAKLEGLDTIRDAVFADKDARVRVPGVVSEKKQFKIRADAKRNAGKDMARATITWKGDTLTFVAFPDTLDEYGFALKEGLAGIFTLQNAEKGWRLESVRALL